MLWCTLSRGSVTTNAFKISRDLLLSCRIRSNVLFGPIWRLFTSGHLYRVMPFVMSGGSRWTNFLFFDELLFFCFWFHVWCQCLLCLCSPNALLFWARVLFCPFSAGDHLNGLVLSILEAFNDYLLAIVYILYIFYFSFCSCHFIFIFVFLWSRR